MEKLRICFHSAIGKAIKKFFISILSSKYEIEETLDYDFYFAQESIYWSPKLFKELLDSKKEAIRIMFCGEAVYPDFNLFDYAVVMQKSDIISSRSFYLPFMEFCNNIGLVFDVDKRLPDSKHDAEKILAEKEYFCNFIYGNPNAHTMRDNIFYAISDYKKVNSLGRHLKNVDIPDSRNALNWQNISVELKKKYKFSIASENAYFPGYTSEKLITSFLANSVPIYWGNPNVRDEFNDKAFINVFDFGSLKDLVDYIKYVDENDSVWCDIISQPARTAVQLEAYNKCVDEFYHNFLSIFSQSCPHVAKPSGTFVDFIYTNYFLNNYSEKEQISFKRILKKMLKY